MNEGSFHEALAWVAAHPAWTGLFVFVVAFLESLAVVGVLVPGAIMMVAFGAAITLDYMAFWPTVAWAVAGAIAGDLLSFWLGYRFKDGLTRCWPLSRHPELLQRGIVFFEKHGGKSVVLGRFVGPLRAIIPTVAGMLRMPLRRFLLANVLSALAWAPLYLAPGIILGVSLELASEVAGRLAVVFLGTLLALYLLIVLLRFVYRHTLPHLDALMSRLLNWSNRHPRLGHLSAAVIDPRHPETRSLSLLALLLVAATLAFVLLMHQLWGEPSPGSLSHLLASQLSGLHNPVADTVAGFFARLADPLVVTLFVTGLCGWFAAHRRWKAVGHLLASLLLPVLTLVLLKSLFALSMRGPAGTETFPISSLGLAVSVYGFTAIVLGGELAPRWRLSLYSATLLLVASMVFARLYLGLDWLAYSLSAILMSTVWFALLGIGYRRHTPDVRHRPTHVPAAAFFLFLAVLAAQAFFPEPAPAPSAVTTEEMASADWRAGAWRRLPRWRDDLRHAGNHPFNLQWAGSADDIIGMLEQAGWQRAPATDPRRLLQWFNPDAAADALPVLPQVHAGRYEDLRLVRPPNGDADHLDVIRLWRSRFVIAREARRLPLWFGTVSTLERGRVAGLNLLRTAPDFATPLARLRAALAHPGRNIRLFPATSDLLLVLPVKDTP